MAAGKGLGLGSIVGGLVVLAFLIVAGVAAFVAFAPRPEPVLLSERTCTFETFCDGADCAVALPPPVVVVRNSVNGRSVMSFDGVRSSASTIQVAEGVKDISLRGPGDNMWSTVRVDQDGRFTFRMTRRLIDGEPLKTGSGTCAPPVERMG